MTFFSRKHLRLLLLPALLLLTGCAGSAKETADSTENEKLSAVATIFPQYDFLRAIGGDHLDLHMLLSPGAESDSFEPTPGDMITVSECDLFVYVGVEVGIPNFANLFMTTDLGIDTLSLIHI